MRASRVAADAVRAELLFAIGQYSPTLRLALKRFSVCARAHRIFFENGPTNYGQKFSARIGEIVNLSTVRANFFIMCDTEQSFNFGTGILMRENIEQ
jgi:hypothetical protein